MPTQILSSEMPSATMPVGAFRASARTASPGVALVTRAIQDGRRLEFGFPPPPAGSFDITADDAARAGIEIVVAPKNADVFPPATSIHLTLTCNQGLDDIQIGPVDVAGMTATTIVTVARDGGALRVSAPGRAARLAPLAMTARAEAVSLLETQRVEDEARFASRIIIDTSPSFTQTISPAVLRNTLDLLCGVLSVASDGEPVVAFAAGSGRAPSKLPFDETFASTALSLAEGAGSGWASRLAERDQFDVRGVRNTMHWLVTDAPPASPDVLDALGRTLGCGIHAIVIGDPSLEPVSARGSISATVVPLALVDASSEEVAGALPLRPFIRSLLGDAFAPGTRSHERISR